MKSVKEFFEKETSTLSYVCFDPSSRDAVIVDPVLDYDPASSKIAGVSARKLIDFVQSLNLSVHYILETHAHADHVSGAQTLKRFFPAARIGMGRRITEVQKIFKDLYALPESFKTDGSQFDVLFSDRQILKAGSLEFEVIFTPGHTPACASYLFDKKILFTGDSIFMPDSGTGRCDFPGGNAETLFDSIQKVIYSLPEGTQIYVGHDYQPNNRPLLFSSTVAEQKSQNIHIRAETTKTEYVKFRKTRDATLTAPRLLFPSLQINIDAGRLPPSDSQGRRFLKLPLFGSDTGD